MRFIQATIFMLAMAAAAAFADGEAPFMKTPFRADGALDENGRWTLWADPGREFQSPGFNCSGFVTAAARELLGKNFTLAEAGRDRRGDSGPGAALGQDWDFGLDLILNLSDGFAREFIPSPPVDEPLARDGRRVMGWGADIHSPDFPQVLEQLTPGRIYLYAISKPDRRFAGGLSYYHVGLARNEGPGELWFYHATPKAGVNRFNVAREDGLAALKKQYPRVSKARGERRVFFIGCRPPAGAPQAD